MTAPAKKRQRRDDSVSNVNKKDELGGFIASCKERSQQNTSELLDTIDSLETSGASPELISQASSCLLGLKALQRELLQQLDSTKATLRAKQAQLQKQSVLLQNLQYERNHLQSHMQANIATPQLDQMCRQIVSEHQDEKKKEELSLDEQKSLVLCGSAAGSPYHDPSQHQAVMATLHKEIHARGTLEREANQAHQEFQAFQQKLSSTQTFLNHLPQKLAQLERASLPLQNFFTKHQSTKNIRIGTERRKRLDLAQSLPAPLYTLFVQLQSYLDSTMDEEQSMSLEIVESQPSKKTPEADALVEPDPHMVNWQVQLPPIPQDAARSTTKINQPRFTIQFYYIPRLSIITAKPYASHSDKVDLPTVLMNLFPGDTGEITWSAEHVMQMKQLETKLPGRPYHWCNYMAGIHLATSTEQKLQAEPLQLSTKVIVQAMKHRLRANVTLTYLLQTLEQRKPHPLPVHPLLESSLHDDVATRLAGWAETASETDTPNNERSFLAVLKRGKTATLQATVTLDPSRYPTLPPKWCLVRGGETAHGEQHGMISSLESGTTPLYDQTLGDIERVLNSEFQELVVEDAEETYDWILVHQLAKMVQLWDASERTNEEG